MKRPVRIANFSGYIHDRPSALAEVLAGDPVDVVIGDYLAEATMATMAAAAQRDPSSGYAHTFLAALIPQLRTVSERGVKVVTNAGGLRPKALATAIRDAAAGAGVGLNVAYVEGDDVLSRLDELQVDQHPLPHLDTGRPLSTWGHEPVSANAYLGGWGIALALTEGADIVVCGRVTDASLTVGPAAWWHGWTKTDWCALAGAAAAGHVIECGPQATGGNFSGFATVQNMTKPGFPIAEIKQTGPRSSQSISVTTAPSPWTR